VTHAFAVRQRQAHQLVHVPFLKQLELNT
jgi:hypothetical protein